MKPWLAALLLVLVPCVAGCGDDATRAPSAVASLPTATALDTPLPTGWPSELQLPAGSKVYDSADRAGMLSVGFDTQELAASVTRFLATELTTAGWKQGAGSTQGDTVTTTWANGTRELEIDLDDTGTVTEIVIRVTDPSSPSASPSASPSTSPSASAG